MMPATEIVCSRCAPGGGPRSYRLPGLRERLLKETSAEKLAAQADVSVATILRAECGRRVRTETATAIAEALGTSVAELAEARKE